MAPTSQPGTDNPPIRWELYTTRARLVITLAQSEARALGCDTIDAGHLVLGLVRERKGLAAQLLADAHLDGARLRTALGHDQCFASDPFSGRLPFTVDVERALDAAQRSHDDYVGTEHLLNGLLADGGDAMADLLTQAGADAIALRTSLEATLARPPHRRQPRARSRPGAQDGEREVLAGLGDAALGLLAEAETTAHAQGCGAIGTDHLLVAALQAGGRPARRLENEGLTLHDVRAQVASAEAGDTGTCSDASTSYLSLPCTTQLRRVIELAGQYAVILESARVEADHLLLAIANAGRCAAFDILHRHDSDMDDRLVRALVADIAGPDTPLWLPYTDTAREAFELAWSTALAHGYAEIQVSHILGALRTPGWTIAARAIAILAEPAPAGIPPMLAGYSSEAHQRIPFAAEAKHALVATAAAASDLGKPYVGSEHVLLGIAETAMHELTPLVSKKVSLPQVRAAVAEAVISADAARDDEARRRGWKEPVAAPGGATSQFRDRLMSKAREVAEAGDGHGPTVEPGCWAGFVAAILVNDDEDLTELLELLQLDPSEIHALCARVEDLPMSAALEWAGQRYGLAVGAAELLIAVISVGSPRARAAIYELGLTEVELVTQLADWRDKRDGTDAAVASVGWVSGANVLFGVGTSVLLVEAVISDGTWWKLVLLGLVWSGHPGLGPAAGLGVAGLLGVLVSPLVGVVQLLSIAFDIAQVDVERQAAWSRTGVRATRRETRCVVRRSMNGAAQANQMLRQLLLAMVRARRRAPIRGADQHA